MTKPWTLVTYPYFPNVLKSTIYNVNKYVPAQPELQGLIMTSHYADVIMIEMASQITSLTVVYSIVNSGADQSKHQSSASLAFVRGIHRESVNSPHKWPVTRKMFPFDDVIMLVKQWDVIYHPCLPFNTLKPSQNGRHIPDDIFKCIFLNENIWISIKISLKYVYRVPIDNKPVLVQIMAWRRRGDKALSEPMMTSLPTHICVTRPQWVNDGSIKPPPSPKLGHV